MHLPEFSSGDNMSDDGNGNSKGCMEEMMTNAVNEADVGVKSKEVHGNSNPNNDVFTVGLTPSIPKRWQRKVNFKKACNKGKSVSAQIQSPEIVRARKRARCEVGPSESAPNVPNTWAQFNSLDLNNTPPNSCSIEDTGKGTECVSQVPDSIIDMDANDDALGVNELPVHRSTPDEPQETSDYSSVPVTGGLAHLQTEEEQTMHSKAMLEIQKETVATIEIANLVGINLDGKHDAVMKVIMGKVIQMVSNEYSLYKYKGDG